MPATTTTPSPQRSAPSNGTPPRGASPGAPKRRVNRIALARFEQAVLPAMARRLPAWFTPDTLTAIALGGAGMMFAGYALAGDSLAWLHLASLGFVVHWWGDSLDGTLARVRNIRRERYGFYVDHQCDVMSVLLLFAGLGLGPLMRLDVALGFALAVLVLFNHVGLVTISRDVFKISFAGVGPTEGRLAMIVANTALWATGNPVVTDARGVPLTAADVFGLGCIALLLVAYLAFAISEGRTIARLDPRPEPGQDVVATGEAAASGAAGDA